MKLRVIQVDCTYHMAGAFVVQRKSWGRWHDLFYHRGEEKLCTEMLLGSGEITTAEFTEFDHAWRLAQKFKAEQNTVRVIRGVWEV